MTALTPRARRIAVLGLFAAALVALALSLAARLVPAGAPAREARAAHFLGAAAEALERDGETLRRTAERIHAGREFAAIADGGGAEVRPAKLFSILGESLPKGAGWGAVFFDRTSRPVAWAGEAAGLEAERGPATSGFVTSFHVTRVFLGWVEPRGERGARGTLVVTRRYPTGILRPDLIEFLDLADGPTHLRLRVSASERRDRLLALAIETSDPGFAEEEVQRASTLRPALVLAALAVGLGLVAGSPAAGAVGARFALLLGTPRGASGVFAAGWDPAPLLGLFGTPADAFLTGLAALVVARALTARVTRRGREPHPAGVLLAIPLALAPGLLGHAAALVAPGLFDTMSLFPAGLPDFLAQTGLLALAAAALACASLLPKPGGAKRSARAAAVLGLGALVFALASAGSPLHVPFLAFASVAFTFALARRARPSPETDLLSRAATALFVVAAATLLFAAGLADGRLRHADAAIHRAEVLARGDGAAVRAEEVRRWERRVASASLEPWLPAGERTQRDDLARALWARGADESFPELGDTLTIRSPLGATVSSFGVIRPGRRAADLVSPAAIPAAFPAEFRHVPWPREPDRDPLLSAVASRDVPDRVAVERLEWDAAGRATGSRGEGIEMPDKILNRARRSGEAVETVPTPDGLRRVHVQSVASGFTGFAAPAEPPLAVAGAAVAAGEAGLVILVPLLFVDSPGRGLALRFPRRFFATFRARLVALVLVFGALPLALSVVFVRIALEGHASGETARRSRDVVSEGRRLLEGDETGGILSPEGALNRAAAVIGWDLLRYRDGTLVAASRALPVAAEVARERLASPIAQELAEGRPSAFASRGALAGGAPRVVEAAEAVSADGREALAVVVAEDEAVRSAADALLLLSVAVALAAVGLGGRAALTLGEPLEELIAATANVGEGRPLPPLVRPANVDLARLVDAFTEMSARVEERTESLAEERASAVGLLENLTAAVLLFRRGDGTVLLANPAADRLLPGGTLSERLAGIRWAPLRSALKEAAVRPSPYEIRVTIPGPQGERFFRVAIVTLPGEERAPRVILLLEDLTDFLRADRLAAWVDAARSIAHDIKNPLTPIRLAAERLRRFEGRRETQPPGAIGEVAAGILRQVGILTDRIGRLGRFGDPAVVERRVLDRAAVARLLDEVAADFKTHETLAIETETDPDLHPFAADPFLVRDALTNFVVNAVEAIGAAPGHVRLSARNAVLAAGEAAVRFACADDGPGVPEDVAGRLFEPTFSTKSRGSGMGLAAVRRAAEHHAGTVFAHPRTGGGLVVGFTLPALSSPS
ncbi:MAG TPA: ATP-binding protein [Thermoanaerobaculia bacterium]|nr:ATP-binding protein [Thermoanaerobaculia bacterium]